MLQQLNLLQATKLPAMMLISMIFLSSSAAGQKQEVYKSGENGYQCFRIPAIITTNKGTLLAFAEARKNNCGDAGDIDLVVKRSADGGRTWSGMIVVWNDGENTCGNPAPVVDRRTGKIILLSTWNLETDHEKDIIVQTSRNTRRIFLLSSQDDGATWSPAKEITTTVKKENWTWYATGPCNGIQITKGKYKGRLVIPCDHIEAGSGKYYSHIIYSDDGGDKWALGGTTLQDQVNECTVAEINNGQLMLNMRNYGPVRARRVSYSKDGGEHWSDIETDSSLVEPVCQASLIRHDLRRKKTCLAFSNPANARSRVGMTVRLSFDWGKTWSRSYVLHKGPSAYSNLVGLPDGNLGCLYEGGAGNPYETILFQEISLSDFGLH